MAQALNVPYDEVMSLARRGIIPRIKAGPRVYFNLARVAEALRARRAAAEPEPAAALH
jgi:hypothetical protein